MTDITPPSIVVDAPHGSGVLDDTFTSARYDRDTKRLTVTGAASDSGNLRVANVPAPTPSPSPATPPVGDAPLGPAGTFNLVWNDEFEGSTIDTSKWKFGESGYGSDYDKHDATIVINPTADQLTVQNGYASIKARANAYAQSRGEVMTTTVLTTQERQMTNFTHGVVECRCRVPMGKSLWPAIWLLGNGTGSNPPQWPGTGEIDILEFFNSGPNEDPNIDDGIGGAHNSAIHATDNGQDSTAYGGTGNYVHATKHSLYPQGDPNYATTKFYKRSYFDTNWHVYTLHRTTNFMDIYVDGNFIYRWTPGDAPETWTPQYPVPQYIFDTPMHFRLDLQVGGEARWDKGVTSTTPGAIEVATSTGTEYAIFEEGDFDIDYVRVFEEAA